MGAFSLVPGSPADIVGGSIMYGPSGYELEFFANSTALYIVRWVMTIDITQVIF